jgi:hypothetical protein
MVPLFLLTILGGCLNHFDVLFGLFTILRIFGFFPHWIRLMFFSWTCKDQIVLIVHHFHQLIVIEHQNHLLLHFQKDIQQYSISEISFIISSLSLVYMDIESDFF